MAQVKAIFYLPLLDNNGRSLRSEIDEVESKLYELFSGWSLTGVIKGVWTMANMTPALDESNAYAIVTDESRLDEIERLLLDFKAKTTQETIYFEVVYNTNVRFL